MADMMETRRTNLSVADLSFPDNGITRTGWDRVLSAGGMVMIAASKADHGRGPFFAPENFSDADIWTTHVWADINSEHSLLEAIYLGRSYVARNGFTGQFMFDSLGFPCGRLLVFVPYENEAILHVKISGVPGGTVHIISQGNEVANATESPSARQLEENFNLTFTGESTYFRAVVTNRTGSPIIMSNPIFYMHKPMLAGSYMYISDPAVSIQSWSFIDSFASPHNLTDFFTHRQDLTELLTRRELSMKLAAVEQMFPVSRNGSAVYVQLPTRESRYRITIANVTRPLDDFYNSELGEYVVPLNEGLPDVIVLHLDRSLLQTLSEAGQGILFLLSFVMIPIVAAGAYFSAGAWLKRRRAKRASLQ
jgi:hypothetical protein